MARRQPVTRTAGAVRVLSFGPQAPPPLEHDDELDAFMAARGWEYVAEWNPPFEDEDGEQVEGFWLRAIVKQVPCGDGFLMQSVHTAGEHGSERAWELLVELAESGLEQLCAQHGVEYRRP